MKDHIMIFQTVNLFFYFFTGQLGGIVETLYRKDRNWIYKKTMHSAWLIDFAYALIMKSLLQQTRV